MNDVPPIRDRVRELRRVKASDLAPSPKNWRTHGESQRLALAGILDQIGYAGALLARELADGSLELIDGHLRRDTTPDAMVPVLVVDVSEEEANLLLASFDPIAALAGADVQKLDALLREVSTGDAALQEMLAGLAEKSGLYDVSPVPAPNLPTDDKAPFQQLTFTLHDTQADLVGQALDLAKKAGPFIGSPNENSNGNALARIAEAYLGRG